MAEKRKRDDDEPKMERLSAFLVMRLDDARTVQEQHTIIAKDEDAAIKQLPEHGSLHTVAVKLGAVQVPEHAGPNEPGGGIRGPQGADHDAAPRAPSATEIPTPPPAPPTPGSAMNPVSR